ncbi:hypothetical protein [Streptomyces sp. KHY 26]|jgi:hypothetical protein|uniref:hypothetical protein n=1 Tax=Streptomyces sp. KHY 26 TaxID=3097359 RepID=UPI00376EACA4
MATCATCRKDYDDTYPTVVKRHTLPVYCGKRCSCDGQPACYRCGPCGCYTHKAAKVRTTLGLLCALVSSWSLTAGVLLDHDWFWLVIPFALAAGWIWTPDRDR